MNVSVISVYFLHPTAIQGTQLLSTLISPFTKHLQGTFKTASDGMQDIQKNSRRKRFKKKKYSQLFTNQISSKVLHEYYVGPLTDKHTLLQLSGGKQTDVKTSRNASWKDFSKQQPNNLHIPQGKKKQNRKTKLQTNKQTPIKKPQRSCVTYKVLCMDKDSNFPCAFPMGSRSIL